MVRRDSTNQLKEIIHEQRSQPTKAEKQLWAALRNRQLGGYKFRRQHPAGGYILDFYCPEVKLGIEVDGEVHKQQTTFDMERENDLRSLGIMVMRFWNSEVDDHLEDVLEQILNRIRGPGMRTDS